MLLEEIKECMNKWKDMLCSQIGRFTLHKVINRHNAIPIKIPKFSFAEIEIFILKFMWYFKGTWIAKTILKKEHIWRSHILDFQTYCNVAVIKTVWYGLKTDRPMEKKRGFKINAHMYVQMIFYKNTKTIQCGSDSLPQMVLWKLEKHTQKNEIRPLR